MPIDTQPPTASIVVDNIFLSTVPSYETSLVTITFSEAVSGFSNDDLHVDNGTLSNVASSDGVTWTATLTPTPGATEPFNRITLDYTGVTDASGNVGVGTVASNNYEVDVVRPTARIAISDQALGIGETAQVTITFSEPIVFADLSRAFTVENGALSNFANSDGGITWTATLTPTAGVTDLTNAIVLDMSQLMDFSSNFGGGTTVSANYTVDATRPTAAIHVAGDVLNAGETTRVTFTFSEAVTGLTTADVTVDHGVLSNLSSRDGGITWTATLTPDARLTDATNVITLDNTGIADLAGNAGSGTSVSDNYAIDTNSSPPPPPLPITLSGTPGADRIIGNDLHNRIDAGDGANTVMGGAGADTVQGGADADLLQGNTGADSLAAGAGDDTVLGGQGNDVLQGNTGNDRLWGDKGNDVVFGGQGDDTIQGGQGNDVVSGDKGDDVVMGGQGDDVVLGGDGNDVLSGDRGSDILTGGAGADIFHTFGAAGADLVTDFHAAEGDRVMLDAGTVYTVAQVGADTVISMEGGGQMILANVELSNLSAGWIFGA